MSAMTTTTKIKGAAASAAPSIATVRHARAELNAAIADGATYLEELRSAVEDALNEALNQARRERGEKP
jgi:hypothetical protein